MKKINLLVTLLDLHFGGISNLTLQTLPKLSEKMNTSVVYFGPNEDMLERFEDAGIKIERIKYDGGKDVLDTSFKLRKYIKKNRIDIVSTNFAPDKLIVSLTRLISKFLIVGTIHNTFNPNITPIKKTWKYRFEEYFHTNICNKVIGVSNAAIENAKKFRDLRNKNLSVIHSGIPPISSKVKKDTKNENIIFITACRLVEIKGLFRLLERFKDLNESRDNWELWIIGDGELKKELIRKAADLNIKEKVSFKGYQFKLDSFYLQADYYINSSYNEALGISIIEAMSIGLPTIGSKVGGIPEVIEDNVNGFLLDFDDRQEGLKVLGKAMDLDSETYKSLVKKSLIIFEKKFSIDSYVKNLYETLLKMKYPLIDL